MECPRCRVDRGPKDFIRNILCYKCLYQEKMKSQPRRKVDRQCLLCEQPVPDKRLYYCSEECKDKADKKRSYEKYHAKKERILMEGSDE